MSLTNLFLSALLLLLQHTVSNHAYFEDCDYTFKINAGVSYLTSPNYFLNYTAGSSCRWKYIAPLDYYIELHCDINIYTTSAGCTTDNLYLDRDGDKELRGAEIFCGTGSFDRTSVFRSLVLCFTSTGSNSGKFNCKLTAKPQSKECGWTATTRMVNGEQANVNQFPSMAALKDMSNNQQSFCGATIISHSHLLSAAQCTQNYRQLRDVVAIVGTNDLANPTNSKYYAMYLIKKTIVHEQFDPQNMNNDIAIFVTSIDIEWSRGVGPACLPPASTTDDFQNDMVDLIGWGTSEYASAASSNLLTANLKIVSNTDCQNQYEGTAIIKAGQVCTHDPSGNGGGPCQYDSGGPVFMSLTHQYIVGIISFGKNCGYDMNVNTRITYYIDWISQKIEQANNGIVISIGLN